MNKEETILMLSKRTVSKILKRANAKCAICGWNDASCDIHHILPKSKKGNDGMDNLICVCPNCHRKIHEHGENFISFDAMKKVALIFTLSNWKEYYNPTPQTVAKVLRKTGSFDYTPNKCLICGKPIQTHMKYCSSECIFQSRKKFEVTKEELQKLIDEMPVTQIAKMFGVCDNAIRTRCEKMKIEWRKGRGFWSSRKKNGLQA